MPIAPNHAIMIGPNRVPTRWVPYRWPRNRMVISVSEIGSTRSEMPGAATFRPSTAESTEIAGVMTLSP